MPQAWQRERALTGISSPLRYFSAGGFTRCGPADVLLEVCLKSGISWMGAQLTFCSGIDASLVGEGVAVEPELAGTSTVSLSLIHI